jgi:hypothetical protein
MGWSAFRVGLILVCQISFSSPIPISVSSRQLEQVLLLFLVPGISYRAFRTFQYNVAPFLAVAYRSVVVMGIMASITAAALKHECVYTLGKMREAVQYVYTRNYYDVRAEINNHCHEATFTHDVSPRSALSSVCPLA